MKKQVKLLWIILLTCSISFLPTAPAHAGIYEIIKAAIVKAIKAADLAIQRAQNKTIWLQNAQKTLENTLAKVKLEEISDWSKKQKEQYQQYFDELHKVKSLISYYQRIQDIMDMQLRIVDEYKRSWSIISSDKHFSARELEYMGSIYSGILSETVKNIEELSLAINSFKTQMSDAKRLEIISKVADNVQGNYTDLKSFTQKNGTLSLQRAKSETDIQNIKIWYGLK